MFKDYKITKHPEGDVVNGKLYKPFWFGPHVNLEQEKNNETIEDKKINNNINFNDFSEKRFEDFVNMFSDRVYIPPKLSNKYIYDINYSREQFQKDVDKVNTRWIREYIKYEIFQGNPLYVNKSNSSYLETSELSESCDSESDDTLSINSENDFKYNCDYNWDETSYDKNSDDNEWDFDDCLYNSNDDDE